MAFFAPVFQAWGWLQNPQEFLTNPIHDPPSGKHWFGTSRLGYDVFSRTLFGAQAALQVVILATALSMLIGVPLGMISGYLGGKLDKVLLFLMDSIYTLPGLLLSVTLASFVSLSRNDAEPQNQVIRRNLRRTLAVEPERVVQ